MESQPKKLNIFQRGILQIITYGVVFVAFIALTGFVVDSFEKWRFIKIIEGAQHQGLITPEGFQVAKNLIESMSWLATFVPVGIGGACVIAGWYSIKWALNRNWSWPITLKKAVEFRFAMRKFGIVDPDEWIPFICKHNIQVFITFSPLLSDEQENVRARRYTRAPNRDLIEKKVFDLNTGRQTLCLDAEDMERLEQAGKRRISLEESAAIAAKDDEIKGLRATQASLVQENAALVKERDELRGKVRIQQAQEDTRVDRLRVERLLWAAYIPVMDRLMRDAAGKQYTTREIEDAFKAEWEQRADLRKHMLHLAKSEEANPSENFIKAVKAEFKEAGQLSPGGRPKGNP